MNYLSKWRRKWHQFLHDEDLKQRIYSIVFESDTPKGEALYCKYCGARLKQEKPETPEKERRADERF